MNLHASSERERVFSCYEKMPSQGIWILRIQKMDSVALNISIRNEYVRGGWLQKH